MVLAGNVTPIDVITHLPIMCEDNGIPYIFVSRKEDLGAAGGTKRPTSCILVQSNKGADHAEYYDELMTKVKAVQPEF
jgi:H/ACA ribonucleoprotein complex subunit 2